MRIILLFFCLFMMSCSNGSPPALHDAEGGVVQLSELKNKWVIINYWAPWCDSCMKEIPELNHFYEHVKSNEVVLYGVNYDQLPKDELVKVIAEVHLKFPVLIEDPNNLLQLGDFSALPVTFILDPSGKVVKKIFGPNTEKSLLATLQVLKKKYQ